MIRSFFACSLAAAAAMAVTACSSPSGEHAPLSASSDPSEGEPTVVRLSQVSSEYSSDFCGGPENRPSNATCRIDGPNFEERENPRCDFAPPGIVTNPTYKWLTACNGGDLAYRNGMTLYRVVRVNCIASHPDLSEAVVRTGTQGTPLFELRAIYDFPDAGKVRALVRADTTQLRVGADGTLDIDIETRNDDSSPWTRTGHDVTAAGGSNNLIEVVGTAEPQQQVRLIIRTAKAGQDGLPVSLYRVQFLSPICIPKPDGTCE